MESKYGLENKYRFDYFPSSANQTPIKWLLQVAFYNTLDFIIKFTNKAVESYSQSDYGKEDIVKITLHINEIEVTQYVSNAIWCMYRGIGSPIVPNVLQSIHMALEKVLLEFSQILEPETIQNILLKILSQSKSASLTSIVCSVVLANSDKFYDVALILFKTIELFHLDTFRCTNEFQAKSLYSIGYGMDKIKDILYSDERLKSCEDKHRNLNLESLFVNYQFFGVKGFSEEQNTQFINQLHEIIDNHNKTIPAKSENDQRTLGILLARMDRRVMKPEVKKQDDSHFIIELNPQLPARLREESELATNQYNESNKYIPLNLWSNFTHNKNRSDINQYCKEYDENPNKALADTKQLINDLKNKKLFLLPMDEYIPCNACSRLMINHKDKLQKEDKFFCEKVILSSIKQLFSDDYSYQIGDSVEAAIRTIPSLIEEYPDKIENYLSIMVLTLFDETSIGAYKRVCDYVIETIHEAKLWELNHKVAQSILFGYIKLKPVYKKIINEKRKKQDYYWSPIPKSYTFKELEKININAIFKNISFSIKDVQFLDIHDLEIVYQLIPSNTKNKTHLDIYTESLPLLASQLLKNRRDYKDNSGDRSDIYKLRLHIFKRFTYFILQREKNEIDVYLKPFIDSFSSTEETALFIAELVLAEDYLSNCEQFWHIWEKLYPKIKDICLNPRNYYLKEIIINYLLAWRWWREDVEEWHSLKYENIYLYTNASKDIGNIPAVLYSIVRVLNSIGTNFKDEGIDWIYNIVSNNTSLDLGDIESNTLHYLEAFLRKFIFINRQKIKEEIRLKNKIIPILDFMIERGSIHGYLLRESIL